MWVSALFSSYLQAWTSEATFSRGWQHISVFWTFSSPHSKWSLFTFAVFFPSGYTVGIILPHRDDSLFCSLNAPKEWEPVVPGHPLGAGGFPLPSQWCLWLACGTVGCCVQHALGKKQRHEAACSGSRSWVGFQRQVTSDSEMSVRFLPPNISSLKWLFKGS